MPPPAPDPTITTSGSNCAAAAAFPLFPLGMEREALLFHEHAMASPGADPAGQSYHPGALIAFWYQSIACPMKSCEWVRTRNSSTFLREAGVSSVCSRGGISPLVRSAV